MQTKPKLFGDPHIMDEHLLSFKAMHPYPYASIASH